jgi:hypothetical protein
MKAEMFSYARLLRNEGRQAGCEWLLYSVRVIPACGLPSLPHCAQPSATARLPGRPWRFSSVAFRYSRQKSGAAAERVPATGALLAP